LNPIFVYDGLYIVEEFWEERGEFGKLVFKFKLKRNLDQPKLPQRLEKKLLLSR
jgi:euchromatic histone-lysine N-methyltransferase